MSGFDILNMDHPMTIRLQASVQSLAFIILLAVTLFGTVGRFDSQSHWCLMSERVCSVVASPKTASISAMALVVMVKTRMP